MEEAVRRRVFDTLNRELLYRSQDLDREQVEELTRRPDLWIQLPLWMLTTT